MIYLETPNNFSPKFQVVSCYVECQGKLLFLHRPMHKSQGGKWGVPAGKVEIGETIDLAIVRELNEETGLLLESNQLQFLRKIAVKHSEHDFVYHMYRVRINQFPDIKINPAEHQDYKWATPQEALSLDLVADLDDCIRMYY